MRGSGSQRANLQDYQRIVPALFGGTVRRDSGHSAGSSTALTRNSFATENSRFYEQCAIESKREKTTKTDDRKTPLPIALSLSAQNALVQRAEIPHLDALFLPSGTVTFPTG